MPHPQAVLKRARARDRAKSLCLACASAFSQSNLCPDSQSAILPAREQELECKFHLPVRCPIGLHNIAVCFRPQVIVRKICLVWLTGGTGLQSILLDHWMFGGVRPRARN
jgi:hypothetical protein